MGLSRDDGPDPIPPDQIRIERFRENADVRAFDCGNRDLNDFLTTEEVGKFEREKLGNTHLVYWQSGGKLLGYFTISSESLRIEYFRSIKGFSIPGEIRVSAIPGMKIGRLAVDNEFKGRDVGSHMLSTSQVSLFRRQQQPVFSSSKLIPNRSDSTPSSTSRS